MKGQHSDTWRATSSPNMKQQQSVTHWAGLYLAGGAALLPSTGRHPDTLETTATLSEPELCKALTELPKAPLPGSSVPCQHRSACWVWQSPASTS